MHELFADLFIPANIQWASMSQTPFLAQRTRNEGTECLLPSWRLQSVNFTPNPVSVLLIEDIPKISFVTVISVYLVAG